MIQLRDKSTSQPLESISKAQFQLTICGRDPMDCDNSTAACAASA